MKTAQLYSRTRKVVEEVEKFEKLSRQAADFTALNMQRLEAMKQIANLKTNLEQIEAKMKWDCESAYRLDDI